MLRPLLALLALSLAAVLLAPSVTSVHEHVAGLDIRRKMPWQLWKWDEDPQPPSWMPPDCRPKSYRLHSEITSWPERITKNESFDLGGRVVAEDLGGVGMIDVLVYLNATKTKPGEYLGQATTNPDGSFRMSARVPHDNDAQHYHLVAHALSKRIGCRQFVEHWSDPELDVTAKTTVVLDLPDSIVIGRDLAVAGTVLDEVGAPVRNQHVNVTVDGKTYPAKTDGVGRFNVTHVVRRVGDANVTVEFAGTKYYSASKGTGAVTVLPEDLTLDGVSEASPLGFVRSEPKDVAGRVWLPPETKPGTLTFAFSSPVVACEGCPPSREAKVQPDAGGNFTLRVLAPSSQPGGPLNVTVTGGGLQKSYSFAAFVYVPVKVDADARGAGLFGRSFNASAIARDETGKPVPGDVGLLLGDQWLGGEKAGEGGYRYQSAASCGVHRLTARYNGTAEFMSAQKQVNVGVCGFLAFLPPWLLAVPWWVWPPALALALALAYLARGWLRERAPTLSRGPPLALSISEPDDAAPEAVGVGERVRLTAQLEEPLPEGLSLRVGAHGRLAPAEVGPDLRAAFDHVPERKGDVALRAEIVDARGRALTRRTVVLRVVRYAEEIEARYRALRRARIGASDEAVSPREFEAWLRERAPDLDPAVARRLVDVFEETDYGPREAARHEFLAYVAAERGLAEVGARVA